jgi:DNA-binding MarR family transcriptional regulator
VDAEELETIVRSAVQSTINEILSYIIDPPSISDEEKTILLKIIKSPSIIEFAERMGVNIDDAARLLKDLRKRGILKGKYRSYEFTRLYAALTLLGNVIKKYI